MILLNLLHGCQHLEAALFSAGMNHLMKGRHLMVGSSLCVYSVTVTFAVYVINTNRKCARNTFVVDLRVTWVRVQDLTCTKRLESRLSHHIMTRLKLATSEQFLPVGFDYCGVSK